MKKQLSSVDLHFIAEELKALEGSRVDKIYHPEKDLLIFSLRKPNEGKKLVNITIGTSMYIVQDKETAEAILGFGQLLRKHIDGWFLYEISQIEPERIVKLSFSMKGEKKHLYIEFFGGGNAILCDDKNTIINAIEHHEFKDRSIKPKNEYKHPSMKCNMFSMSSKDMSELFANSKKDYIVTCLAIELGLGGVYSEEVCTLAEIDKKTSPKEIKDVKPIYNSIKKIIESKLKPIVVYENGNVIDAVPFQVKIYNGKETKQFETFSSALEFFYSNFKEVKENEHDKALGRLNRIIEEQKTSLESLKSEEKEAREKAEGIYHKYAVINEILEELNKASKKHTWKEIKEKLKGHKTILEINEKERKAVIEI
ncbi:MAG: NFACT family protein [Nanoarchaeota archaeon]